MLALLSIPRATEPHLPTLAATLAPLLAVATCGSFHLHYDGKAVVIEQATFDRVNRAAVDAAVAAAPDRTARLDVKAELDAISPFLKVVILGLLDLINTERAQHGRSQITPEQAWTQLKTKVDVLASADAATTKTVGAEAAAES